MAQIKKENVLKDCETAITKEIAKEFREEANEIIRLASKEVRKEFLDYHKKGQGNICCMILDKAKRDLIAEGRMESNDDDAFGKPFML